MKHAVGIRSPSVAPSGRSSKSQKREFDSRENAGLVVVDTTTTNENGTPPSKATQLRVQKCARDGMNRSPVGTTGLAKFQLRENPDRAEFGHTSVVILSNVLLLSFCLTYYCYHPINN